VIGHVRMIVRLVLLVVWTLAMYSVRLATTPSALFSTRLDHACRRVLFSFYSKGVARIVNLSMTVRGTPPKPPFFLVSNHLTYIDGVVLASQLGCVFVAKSEVANWPVIGFFTKQLNVIFVNRERRADTVRVNDCIADAMAMGEGVAMFAESTTSRGADIMPFKSALLEVAVRNQFPVHYAAIHYNTPPGTPPASQWVCWWKAGPHAKAQSFAGNVLGVLRQPGFNAIVVFGDEPIAGTDRKQLAQDLRAAAQKIFIPIE